MSNFTDKQRQFINHYVLTLNATESARRAGYSGDDNALAQRGHENVRNSKIRAEIDRILAESTMSAHEVLARLTAHARGDIGDFIDPTTFTLDFNKARELGITHLIKKVKQTVITRDDEQEEYFEFELHDPQKALIHLGKVYALFKDRHVVEDWRSRAIDDIRAGRIAYGILAQAFDEDLATQLFKQAGVPIDAS